MRRGDIGSCKRGTGGKGNWRGAVWKGRGWKGGVLEGSLKVWELEGT